MIDQFSKRQVLALIMETRNEEIAQSRKLGWGVNTREIVVLNELYKKVQNL